ncbi:hypothetical protein [Jatrophihabitans fulvus]
MYDLFKAFAIVLVVAVLLESAYWMDRADRRHRSKTASAGLIGRRFRDARRLARQREAFRGDVPGTDWAKHRDQP